MDETAKTVAILIAIIGMSGTVIGAIVGFAGGLITQLVLEGKKQAVEKKKKKAEKLEELVSVIWEHSRLLNAGETEGHVLAPIDQTIESICTVYFSELREHCDALFNAGNNYGITRADKRNEIEIKAAKETYQKCMATLIVEIEMYAQREL